MKNWIFFAILLGSKTLSAAENFVPMDASKLNNWQNSLKNALPKTPQPAPPTAQAAYKKSNNPTENQEQLKPGTAAKPVTIKRVGGGN